jgi:hypothetical protein
VISTLAAIILSLGLDLQGDPRISFDTESSGLYLIEVMAQDDPNLWLPFRFVVGTGREVSIRVRPGVLDTWIYRVVQL